MTQAALTQLGEKQKRLLIGDIEKDKRLASRVQNYCAKVCGGKCCRVWVGPGKRECLSACPKLTSEGACGIYRERFEEGKPFAWSILVVLNEKERRFLANCGNIDKIIAAGTLPKWIEDQCCYAHPELLRAEHEQTTTE